MSTKICIHKKRISSFLIFPAIAIWLFSGCATSPVKEAGIEEAKGSVIEKISVSPSTTETVVEIVSSGTVPYMAFKLIDPPRVILDLRGMPGKDLPMSTDVGDGNLETIRFEDGKTQTLTTRMVVNLARQVDYQVSAVDNVIRLSFTPKQPASMANAPKGPEALPVVSEEKIEEARYVPSEPRIHFKPKSSDLNQVLGIDFTMLGHGKSRLTVTTDSKVRYDLDRKGAKSLVLKLVDTRIPPLLLREIDTSQFKSAMEGVKPAFSSDKKEVTLAISLKEMVPFHVKQTDNGLNMDFGPTTIRPPEKNLVPLKLAAIETKALAAVQTTGVSPSVITAKSPTALAGKKKYKGEPMYLDFVNADVTHILRLINEVSEKNIIWDPAIKGKKVSMILRNVPWDQALELILVNNDLGERDIGNNIVWITTKAKIKQKVAEEEAAVRKIQKQIEDERKKKEEAEKKAKEKAKVEEPLITEYLPVDFATADEIKGHIILTKRGKMSIDTRTNTIIIKDIASSIEEAKKTVKQFDTPVKQIMIEARIVDASTNLTRDLGVQWNSLTAERMNSGGAFGTPVDPTTGFSGNGRNTGGSFSTTSPWTTTAGNIGLNFGRLTSSGLGYIALDAALALAETEGEAKIMSAPKVIAREGTAATISSGESIVIGATENVAATTIDATLSLTVTPTAVSYNNFITLDVQVTDDNALASGNIAKKAITTTLMVKNGDTVVIGGVIKETETEDEAGVPGLRKIPFLGWLFKAQNKVHTKSELLIFLTPTVLPSPVKKF